MTTVLLTYNCAPRIRRTLRALLGLRLPVVAVDNASTDGTLAELERHKDNSGLTILPLRKNIGAAGRNEGVKAAKSAYIAFADDDTWWEIDGLKTAAMLLDSHLDLALINSRILVGSKQRLDPISEEMARSPLRDGGDIPGWPIAGFMAGAAVIRRSAYLEVGGYDRKYFMGGEEETLALKLLRRGWLMRYVPAVVSHHYPSRQNAPNLRHYGIRNTIWAAWRHRPPRSAWRWTRFVVNSAKKDLVLAKGLGMAVAGVPWLMRHRQPLPTKIEAQLARLDADKMKGNTARQYGTLEPDEKAIQLK